MILDNKSQSLPMSFITSPFDTLFTHATKTFSDQNNCWIILLIICFHLICRKKIRGHWSFLTHAEDYLTWNQKLLSTSLSSRFSLPHWLPFANSLPYFEQNDYDSLMQETTLKMNHKFLLDIKSIKIITLILFVFVLILHIFQHFSSRLVINYFT